LKTTFANEAAYVSTSRYCCRAVDEKLSI
jgi:hypothetical protein